MSKERASVAFRLDSLSPEEQAIMNAWIDAQKSIQATFPALIIHMANTVGFKDFFSFEVQRQLHIQSASVTPLVVPTVVPSTPKENTQQPKQKASEQEELPSNEPKETTPTPEPSSSTTESNSNSSEKEKLDDEQPVNDGYDFGAFNEN